MRLIPLGCGECGSMDRTELVVKPDGYRMRRCWKCRNPGAAAARGLGFFVLQVAAFIAVVFAYAFLVPHHSIY